MATIKAITSREILDSRGHPTVQTRVELDNGWYAESAIPSGASIGRGEAAELRDKDPNRYQGKGVLKAVANVNDKIAPMVVGKDPTKQQEIDQSLIDLDGTPNKAALGANALLSVSQAVCKAAALAQGLHLFAWIAQLAKQTPTNLPTPMVNVINGGSHGPDNLDFQEFLLIPYAYSNFSEALQTSTQVYYQIRKVLIDHKASTAIGDEGGYAPNLFTNLDAFEVISQAIGDAGFSIGKNFVFGIDVAANYIISEGHYHIRDKTEPLDTNELIGYYEDAVASYPIVSIEDPLEESDWSNWAKITTRLGAKVNIVGDDLIVTHKTNLEKAVNEKAANSVIIKPNQVGTLTETLEVTALAKKNQFKTVVSHRSGETNDAFIADFAVGTQADYVKFGAPARGERVAKYNRLLLIEQYLQSEKKT
jgi:enolase